MADFVLAKVLVQDEIAKTFIKCGEGRKWIRGNRERMVVTMEKIMDMMTK